MRSSKSRSRSKSNRQRSPMGNIQNRVFDSSGPEGKVRGTPQQIIDKYLTLARDAQLSNDRVAAENFLQHAEHYARMLGEAQREMDAFRQQNGGQYQGGERQDGEDRRDQPDEARERRDERRDQPEERREDRRPEERRERAEPATDVLDVMGDEDPGLVETPEMRGFEPEANGGEERQGRSRRNRGRGRPRDEAQAEPAQAEPAPEAPESPV